MKKVKEDDNKWSQLPTLVIWMIKDRLFSFVDILHLSMVCKDWKVASETYPFKSQPRPLAAPWLLHHRCNTIVPTTECELLNLSTNEKFLLRLPEMLENDLLYSKQGWLLFRQKDSERILERPVILLHLYTNTKIIMSAPADCVQGYIASFSCSPDGNPEFVVFDASRGTCKTFCVATVGDNNWVKYSYETGRLTSGHTSLVILNTKIYCMEQLGSLCVFDMSNLVWTEVLVNEVVEKPISNYGFSCSYHYSWINETDKGEIVMARHVWKGSFKFFKLNESTTGWEVLNDRDMEGMSWFFSRQRNNQYIVREMGVMKKVYHAYLGSRKFRQVDIYDLFDGSVKSYRTRKDIHWVDLGTVFKVPPSCVSYEPPGEW